MSNKILDFFTELKQEIIEVSLTLFKIMIPAIIIIKILDELVGTVYLSKFFEPFMSLLNLPETFGLVWATTILTNIYAGIIVFFQVIDQQSITVAQVTVLSCLLLIAHSMPIEVIIAKKSGLNLSIILTLRILGAFIFAYSINYLYQITGIGHEAVVFTWKPEPILDDSLELWILSQLKSFVFIQLIIIVLITSLKILKKSGIEKLMIILLRPILRLLGISNNAASLTVIGITLGLSFGGALLINEAQKGHIKPKDISAAIMLLCLLHSIIEDTLLILLLGADITAVLWGRLVFSFIVIAIITRVIAYKGEEFGYKYIYSDVTIKK